MKKLLILLPLFLVAVLVAPKAADAVYIDSVTHEPITLDYGHNCTLTPNPSEKSSTIVYTLNIALTNRINYEYYKYWGRYARCDELQWHAEHNTEFNRLTRWLQQVQIQRYNNHEYDGLFRTDDIRRGADPVYATWRLINGKRQRVYDWPTQIAWGYVWEDGRGVPNELIEYFYAAYPEIEPLQYSEGPYIEQFNDAWHNFNPNVDMPQRLLDEVIANGFNSNRYFFFRNPCDWGSHGCGYLGHGYSGGWTLLNPCYYGSYNERQNPVCPELDEYLESIGEE